jgi:hypothetical protein
VTAPAILAAIEAAIAAWDAAKPDCTVTTIGVGAVEGWTATRVVELQKTYGADVRRKIAVHFLVDDFRGHPDPESAVRDELNRHEAELDRLHGGGV